ncbi:hypothetical protein ABZ917_46950 [Nonomuraea wenchangensis]
MERTAYMTGQALRKILLKRIDQAAQREPTIAGHASPTTTARYDRRPKATSHAAVKRLRLPDRAPQPGADQ